MPCCLTVAIIRASMKHPLPARPELGTRDGLAYALFLPPVEPRAGVVICHGSGSPQESPLDFARPAGADHIAPPPVDARGPRRAEGRLGPRAIHHPLSLCGAIRQHTSPIAPRA